MATSVASPSSPIVSPPSPSPNGNTNNGGGGGTKSGSRMFRTLSRFLSGSSNKAQKQPTTNSNRPKLDSNVRNNSDPATSGQYLEEGERVSQRGQGSSMTSLSTSTGDNDELASSMVAQYPNDSVSHLSRHDSSSSSSSVRTTSTSRSLGRTRNTRNENDDDDADTDASIYRLPPSTRGPSSITSRRTHDSTTSSFAPTHASTYRSIASTKPTTLLSVDSGGGNRIAVVPGTGSHFQSSSSGPSNHPNSPATSVSTSSPSPTSNPIPTFSSLSPSLPPFAPSHAHRPSTSSTTSSLLSLPNPSGPEPHSTAITGIPSHTLAHPRNNPHPSQIPPDNASLLTLASSSFAPSFTLSTHTTNNNPTSSAAERPNERPGGGTGTRTSSWGGGGLTSLKAWSAKRGQTGSSKLVNSTSGGGGGGTSFVDGGGAGGDADEDASVRVLPGSRRNSEESLGGKSTWSAMVPSSNAIPGGGSTHLGASRKSVVSVKVGDHDLDEKEKERERDKRRSSMKTVATGYTGEREDEGRAGDDDDDELEAIEKEKEEVVEAEETEAQGVKKRAEERHDSQEKGKGVDAEEHRGSVMPPAVPLVE
ncbi:hypothetical protein JCM16303_000713 [Sporobolomyces ruberrimus]